jgi:hypothetical protein
MTDRDGEPPLAEVSLPPSAPPLQPWSTAARGMVEHEGRRRSGRRRQLSRFNDGLALIVAREIEEHQTIDQLLTVILQLIWAPVILTGGVLIHRCTGTHEYSVRELAAYLAVAIIVGLSIDPLWRKFRGVEQPARSSQPDPHAPGAAERGFTRLGLARHAGDEPEAKEGNG